MYKISFPSHPATSRRQVRLRFITERFETFRGKALQCGHNSKMVTLVLDDDEPASQIAEIMRLGRSKGGYVCLPTGTGVMFMAASSAMSEGRNAIGA